MFFAIRDVIINTILHVPIHDIYVALVAAKGMRPRRWPVSPPTRKIVTITLIMWKKGVNFPTPNSCISKLRLSLSGEQGFPSRGFSPGGGSSASGELRFEGEYQSMRLACCFGHRITYYTRCTE